MPLLAASRPSRDGVLSCPVCGGAGALEQIARDGDLYRCADCDHCFSDPQSIRHVETYGPEYYDKNWFQHANEELFVTLGRLIHAFKSDARVLDIGCGNGAFLQHLRKTYPKLTLVGSDLSSTPPYDGIEFIQGDIFSDDISRRFDVVVSLATIEHVADVGTFVEHVKRLCLPDGLVITMTLNDRSALYSSARLLARLGFSGPRDQLYSGHHLNHFNTESLRKLVEIKGLTVKQVLLHNIPLAAVDVEGGSSFSAFVQRCGVFGLFQLGNLTGRTYLQTVICTNGTVKS